MSGHVVRGGFWPWTVGQVAPGGLGVEVENGAVKTSCHGHRKGDCKGVVDVDATGQGRRGYCCEGELPRRAVGTGNGGLEVMFEWGVS